MRKIFLNLTNGIEWLPEFKTGSLTGFAGFVRIQSTQLERHQLDRVLAGLSDDFLMAIARGHKVIVLDCGQKRSTSRSVWEGVEWIRYALLKAWFDLDPDAFIFRKMEKRKTRVTHFFKNRYKKIDPWILDRIKYFKNFLINDRWAYSAVKHLEGRSRLTIHDGDFDFYREILDAN